MEPALVLPAYDLGGPAFEDFPVPQLLEPEMGQGHL